MGLETQIQYNLKDLLENKCRLNQAVIRDKRFKNLFMIPASLKSLDLLMYKKEFSILIETLKEEFDYCLIDCPAGIEFGFDFAVSAADRAIVVTTPGVTALKDASRVINLLIGNNLKLIDLLINEYDPRLVRKGQMLSKNDIEEILGIKAIGVIPKDNKILVSQNQGIPVITYKTKSARKFLEISAKSFYK